MDDGPASERLPHRRAVALAFLGEHELSERQGAVLVVLSGVAFSVTALVFRLVDSATDFQFLTYRGLSTVAAMVLLIAVRRRTRRPVLLTGVTWRNWLAAAVLASTSMLYILALARTAAATTLFLLAAAPVVAATLGWLLLGERVDRATVAAIAITLVGVVVMVGSGLETGSVLGVVLAVTIPITIGLYSVLTRSAAHVDPVVPATMSAVMLTIVSGVVAIAIDGSIAVSWRDAALATISGGVALGIGLPLFNLGHRSVPAAKVPLLLMTEVVLAPLWVWVGLGEQPAAAALIGGAVIIGAVTWLTARSAARHPAVPAPTTHVAPTLDAAADD